MKLSFVGLLEISLCQSVYDAVSSLTPWSQEYLCCLCFCKKQSVDMNTARRLISCYRVKSPFLGSCGLMVLLVLWKPSVMV